MKILKIELVESILDDEIHIYTDLPTHRQDVMEILYGWRFEGY